MGTQIARFILTKIMKWQINLPKLLSYHPLILHGLWTHPLTLRGQSVAILSFSIITLAFDFWHFIPCNNITQNLSLLKYLTNFVFSFQAHPFYWEFCEMNKNRWKHITRRLKKYKIWLEEASRRTERSVYNLYSTLLLLWMNILNSSKLKNTFDDCWVFCFR